MIRQAPTVLVILLGLAGMLSVYLAAWAQVRSRVPGAQEFTLLMVAVSVYSLGYAIEISRIDLPGILEAIKIEYIGIVVIPPLNLLFALRLVRGKPTPWYIAALLLVIPAITLALVWTVESHTLFYINPTVVNDVFFTVIHFTRGPWYYANLVYLQALPAVSFLLLLSHLRGAGPRLACTHYPLLKEKIEEYLPVGVKLLSQGEIVAVSLADYLQRHPEIESRCSKEGRRSFYTTDSTEDFDQHATVFFGQEVASKHVDLDAVVK